MFNRQKIIEFFKSNRVKKKATVGAWLQTYIIFAMAFIFSLITTLVEVKYQKFIIDVGVITILLFSLLWITLFQKWLIPKKELVEKIEKRIIYTTLIIALLLFVSFFVFSVYVIHSIPNIK